MGKKSQNVTDICPLQTPMLNERDANQMNPQFRELVVGFVLNISEADVSVELNHTREGETVSHTRRRNCKTPVQHQLHDVMLLKDAP